MTNEAFDEIAEPLTKGIRAMSVIKDHRVPRFLGGSALRRVQEPCHDSSHAEDVLQPPNSLCQGEFPHITDQSSL
jgi:hypothetical protein